MGQVRNLVRKIGRRELALIIFAAFVSAFATKVVDWAEVAAVWVFNAVI